jgi:hypothetical protein
MIMMNIKEILQGYFSLTPLQKDDLLVQLSNHYFQEGIDLGMSATEIVACFQPIIDEAVRNDDFEVAQAFKDIKDAIQVVLEEKMKGEDNGL